MPGRAVNAAEVHLSLGNAGGDDDDDDSDGCWRKTHTASNRGSKIRTGFDKTQQEVMIVRRDPAGLGCLGVVGKADGDGWWQT